MTLAFGGPSAYRGRPLREAHAALVAPRGLNDTHFDTVARHPADTLAELNDQATTIDEMAIPLPDRVRMLLERRVAFFTGEQPVEASVALAALRRARTAPAR